MVVHPPKQERFDIAAKTNIDPKGITRAVDEFREEPFGLYLARATPGRTQFSYLESWLLPDLGLRVTDFWFNPGHELEQDFYVDVVEIDIDDGVWTTTDLYLDLAVRRSRSLRVVDTDELLEAVLAGHVAPERAQRALERAYRTVEGLAAHQYDLVAWLAATGVTATWRRHSPG